MESNTKVRITRIDLTKPVKFEKPLDEYEKKMIFRINNYNLRTRRVYITPINHDPKKLPILGEYLVSIEDLINA